MKSLKQTLLANTAGASMVEYLVVAGTIALLVSAAFTQFGATLQKVVGGDVTTLSASKGEPAPPYEHAPGYSSGLPAGHTSGETAPPPAYSSGP